MPKLTNPSISHAIVDDKYMSESSQFFTSISKGIDDHQSAPTYFVVITLKHDGSQRIIIRLRDVRTQMLACKFADSGILLPREEVAEIRVATEALSHSKPTVRVLSSIGYDGERFVSPLGIFPPFAKGVEAVCQFDAVHSPDDLQGYACEGTLNGWQELLSLAPGNSRMIFALSLAFAGPLSAIMGHLPLNFSFVGEGGRGKTALARVASSVWGWDKSSELGFGRSCNGTQLGLQSFVGSRRHGFAFLDEPATGGGSSVVAAQLLQLSFVASSGQGRARLTGKPDGQMVSQQSPSVETAILLTSNTTTAQFVADAREVLGVQHLERLIDIPFPDGSDNIFETLHGRKGLSNVFGGLIGIAEANHGVAARAFLRKLGKDHAAKREQVESAFLRWEAEYLKACECLDGGRDLERLNRSFARVYVAGRAAVVAEVLTFKPSEILEAVLACQRDHLEWNADAVAEMQRLQAVGRPDALAQLKRHFKDNRASFFDRRATLLSKRKKALPESACFISKEKGGDYALFPDAVFTGIVGNEKQAREVKLRLKKNDAILTEASGNGSPRFVVKRRVLSVEPSRRFVAIDVSALS